MKKLVMAVILVLVVAFLYNDYQKYSYNKDLNATLEATAQFAAGTISGQDALLVFDKGLDNKHFESGLKANIHASRATVYLFQHDFAQARQAIEASLALSPWYVNAHVLLAALEMAQDNYLEAAKLLLEAQSWVQDPAEKATIAEAAETLRVAISAVEPDQLYRDFQADPRAARSIYQPLDFALRGVASQITVSPTGRPVVVFAVPGGEIRCELMKEHAALQGLQAGNTMVLIGGIVEVEPGNVSLLNCVLVTW